MSLVISIRNVSQIVGHRRIPVRLFKFLTQLLLVSLSKKATTRQQNKTDKTYKKTTTITTRKGETNKIDTNFKIMTFNPIFHNF